MRIDQDNGVLKIAGDAGINDVEQLHRSLCDFNRTASPVIVDLSGLESCDTAILQLLCSARKTAAHAGKPCEFLGLPPAVLDASAVLGLSLAGEIPSTRLSGGTEDAAI